MRGGSLFYDGKHYLKIVAYTMHSFRFKGLALPSNFKQVVPVHQEIAFAWNGDRMTCRQLVKEKRFAHTTHVDRGTKHAHQIGFILDIANIQIYPSIDKKLGIIVCSRTKSS